MSTDVRISISVNNINKIFHSILIVNDCINSKMVFDCDHLIQEQSIRNDRECKNLQLMFID